MANYVIYVQNLWTVIDSILFSIRMQLAKTYLIPVLLYGCEISVNCDSHDKWKLNLAYNNIARYVFLKGRQNHISHSAYQIFGVKIDNLLKISCLILWMAMDGSHSRLQEKSFVTVCI